MMCFKHEKAAMGFFFKKVKKAGDYSKGQSSREESAVVLAGQVWEMETAAGTEGVGGIRERNALPIDYLTHISTSDL